MENSEVTWKKATKCKKFANKYIPGNKDLGAMGSNGRTVGVATKSPKSSSSKLFWVAMGSIISLCIKIG